MTQLPPLTGPMGAKALLAWLRTPDRAEVQRLWETADQVRQRRVGDQVHLRGLVEIGNSCVRQCGYCGLRAGNAGLPRYRMSDPEILECARQARDFGYGTVVLQSGEDPWWTRERVAALVRALKAETGLAVTLSLGERHPDDLAAWKEAGADRYLLRFETSDRELFQRIHPALPGRASDRIALLKLLREIGYEVGSGIMVGIPGQSYLSLARDLELFAELRLDMIGLGPFLAHPDTPLGAPGVEPHPDQVPATEDLVYRALSLARIQRPDANLPATTALATINRKDGRILGLQRGANVVMPNLTPPQYRELYRIYPDKACSNETASQCRGCLAGQLAELGRAVGVGPGSSPAYASRHRLHQENGGRLP